jgi:PAS domain S-box-containing protein
MQGFPRPRFNLVSPINPAAASLPHYMDVVFLVYGLAFLSLGLTISLRNERDSSLKASRILWLLAAFAFVHGFLEWMELWRVVHGETPALAIARPLVLLASFLLLFEFGRRLVLLSQAAATWKPAVSRLLSPWIHAPLLLGILAGVASADQPLLALTIWTRYLPGFFGACLAGSGFYLYYHHRIGADTATSDYPGQSVAWYAATVAFVAYGFFGGLVVPRAEWFPAALINEESFLAAFGIPVQLLRASCAVIAAFSVGSLLRIFGLENQRKLRHALDVGQHALAEFYRINPRYEAILDSVAEGIVGLDGDGNTLFVNDPALDMLGYQRDELLGQPFHALSHHTKADGKPYAAADCPILHTMRRRTVHRVDHDLFWRKNRTWFSVSYQAAPLQQGKQILGVVVVFQDMTEARLSVADPLVPRSGQRLRTQGK